MMADLAAVARRSAQLDSVIKARLASSEDDLAAIEIVPEDVSQREEDLRLVRQALDAGATPGELGALFITVVTNFAYEVDWKDQFCFWPKMHEHLRSRGFSLRETQARRAVEQAFQAFSEDFRGVRPVGDMLQHFPLMSWPLIHAVMPWCAQRHVARVLDRAAADGLIPEDPASPWPENRAEALAASMRVPAFVMGIVQNPTVLTRLGRVLLGDAPRADAPSWVRRLHRGVDSDALARSLVVGARDSQRERTTGRVSRSPGLPISLLLEADPIEASDLRLWAALGPYGRAVASSLEVLSFARTGAVLVARIDGVDAGRAPLFNALAAPALIEIVWRAESLRVQPSARAYEGSDVPDALKRAETGADQEFKLPLVFRSEDEHRYALLRGRACVGERIAVVAARTSSLPGNLKARGFTAKNVRGAPRLVALIGDANESVAPELKTDLVAFEARTPTLAPRLMPALRRDGERLVYRAGRDLWLGLRDAPGGVALSAEVVRAGEAHPAEVGDDDMGNTLVRVPADALAVGSQQVRILAGGRARALASVDVVIEVPAQEAQLTRWRAALHPAEASIEHLRENQCWLEVESIPGVLVEVELRIGDRAGSILLGVEERSPLTTARRLRSLAVRVLPSREEVLERVELRARASDEPGGWLTIGTLGASQASLRFDVSADAPVIVAPDDAPSLLTLEFGPDGLLYEPVSTESLGEAGLYLAKVGASRAALCACDGLRRLPRVPHAKRFIRSVERSIELFSTLRAVDVAAMWPQTARASGLLMRRASARAIERELVGALCGRAWVEMEDSVERSDQDALLRSMAALLWIDEGWLREHSEGVDDPLVLLGEILEKIGDRPDTPEARHLTLSFYQRGMTTRGQDEAAVRWAWASVRRARAARACYLVDPEALTDPADGAGDDSS